MQALLGKLVLSSGLLDGVEFLPGSLDELLDLLDGRSRPMQADPFEGRLAALDHLGLADQTDRGQDISDVIESSDFGLEHLLV